MKINAAIDTAILFTSHMEALASFYQAGLQLGEPQRSPGHIGFQVGPVYLGFDQVEKPWKTPSAVTLWFRVDDVHDAFNHFVALGARVHYAPVKKPWGDILAAVYDPDGNVIGLSQRNVCTQLLS